MNAVQAAGENSSRFSCTGRQADYVDGAESLKKRLQQYR